MNKVILMGRLTRDAEIKAGANTTIARKMMMHKRLIL